MKPKINLNRPELSSEEINKRKDFDSVLKQHVTVSKPFFKKVWFISSAGITLAAVATAVIFYTNSTTNRKSEIGNPKSEIPSPPLKELNIPYLTKSVTAETGDIITLPSGSTISIPENSFADEKGTMVKGAVELRYREFRDAADFFLSGIPMTYDSAGNKYQFESAGMIEVLAYKNREELSVAKNKSIVIELASDTKGTEYNLYKLAPEHNNWSCLGKDKILETAPVKNNVEDFNDNTIDKSKVSFIETKKQEVIKEKENKIAALPKPDAEPKRPQQSRKDKYTFNIDVEEKEFPELELYKNILFEIGEENKNFNPTLYSITWEDANLREGTKKGENYFLSLKKGSKKYEFVVYPVFEGKNYEEAVKIFKESFTKYTAALNKRKTEEKRIEEEYQAKLLELKRQQEAAALQWQEQQANQFKLMDTNEKVKRVFAISSFGIYNSDACKAYPTGVLCSANLVTENNVKLLVNEIYLVDKGRKALFTYTQNPVMRFSFNPESTNMLWTVENGVLYWLKPEQFKDVKASEGMLNLKLTRVEQKFKTPEEFKEYFKFL